MISVISFGADKKILIAYFSRAGENYNVGTVSKGSTEVIAEMIAKETGGDLLKEWIKHLKSRDDTGNFKKWVKWKKF